MAIPRGDVEAALELFAPLGLPLTHRAMMGGVLLYADGRIFASIMPDLGICIRAKSALADRMAAEGARQFIWTKPSDGTRSPMGYWSLPEAALDDPDAACEWAREALKEG